jgi:predicted TIM-barrel fold metal-dependent hydrolase
MSSQSISRRDAIKFTTVGAVALAAGEQIMEKMASAAQGTAACIDAHSHIWTRDVKKYPLAKGQTEKDLSPPSFTAEELINVAKSENVDRVVLICHHPYYGFDNSYLLESAAKYPQIFRIVGALDESQPQPDGRMRALLQQRVTGFRISPHVSGGPKWLESSGMKVMWQTAADTKQSMCCLINPEHLPQVEKMCENFRQTPVVIDHFARIGVDGEIRKTDVDRLCALARFDHVHVKISAFYALGQKKPPYHDLVPMIKRLHGEFGPERLMWASDSPYQLEGENNYRASISLVRDHLNFLSEKDREWLLYKTAEQVFFFT